MLTYPDSGSYNKKRSGSVIHRFGDSMTNLQRVAPSVVDGIEFYVSTDGVEVGVSQSGLARLCGVNESSLRALLTRVETGQKGLEHLQGNVFHIALEGYNSGKPAKLISSNAAVAIIEYYAFTSAKKSEVALFSFRKFAHLGFDRWVKDITGYAKDDNNALLLATMQQVLSRVEDLTAEVKEYKDIRRVTINVYPGLDSMLDTLPSVNSLPSAELRTAKEWLLEQKGITLTHDRLSAFGRLVSDTYKSMTGELPKDRTAKVAGKWINIGKGYAEQHYPILETAWKQFSN